MSVPPRLVSRLPRAGAGQLIRLSARNHYVDVVTDKGTSSLLIRMADAIAELDGVDGLRVHRSHWVAAWAVRGHERQGDKRVLILADGARIPVSRNLQRDVAARGFLYALTGTGRATAPIRIASASGFISAVRAASLVRRGPPVNVPKAGRITRVPSIRKQATGLSGDPGLGVIMARNFARWQKGRRHVRNVRRAKRSSAGCCRQDRPGRVVVARDPDPVPPGHHRRQPQLIGLVQHSAARLSSKLSPRQMTCCGRAAASIGIQPVSACRVVS